MLNLVQSPDESKIEGEFPSCSELPVEYDSAALDKLEINRLQQEVNSCYLRLGEPMPYPVINEALTASPGAGKRIERPVSPYMFNPLLAESEKRYEALFDLCPVAIFAIDAEGRIKQFNRHAAELWGQVPKIGDADVRYCGSRKLYWPDGTHMPHNSCPMVSVVSGEIAGLRDAEVVMERPDGSRITVIVNIVPIKDESGNTIGALNCFYDISDRSRMEREIRSQAVELNELHRRKDEFLAMLSHELRNPLAPILSAVQVLRLLESENEHQKQAHGVIERQVGQMVRLINDLMDISRVTTGKVQLNEKDMLVNDVVARAVETTQAMVDARRHKLTVSLPLRPVRLHADADRMEQVIVNLITNAAKYTDIGGHIWLTVVHDGDVMELRVRDSGIGISPQLLPRVFDLFSQADQSLARSHGGLGVGLCLVQRLVALHGGNVTVESVLGEGSEFCVRMPAIRASVPCTSLPLVEKQSSTAKRWRVLVVDDNVDGAVIQQTLLESIGHEVRVAHDGFDALEAASDFRPDVVLLDIGLPGLNGYEVAKAIREQPILKGVLLIAVTGYGLEADRQRTRQAGFDHHLVKPADFTVVQRLLRAHHSSKTLE
jgi:PAS domain S-box-containing protein